MRRAVVGVLVASSAVSGCGAGDGRSVVLEAWPQIDRSIVVISDVNGDVEVDEVFDRRWSREVSVDEPFEMSMEVVDTEGDVVRCSIGIDGADLVAAVGNGTARCQASGALVDGAFVVESDTFGATASNGSGPTDEADTPAGVAPVELVEDLLVTDLPTSWRVDRPVTSAGSEPDVAAEFGPDGWSEVVRVVDPDTASSISVARVDGGEAIGASLDDLAASLPASVNPNGSGDVVALGPVELGQLDAAHYVVDIGDRRLSWFALRAGGRLFIISTVDLGGDEAMNVVLDTIRLVE